MTIETTLTRDLADSFPAGSLVTDPAERAFYAQDVHRLGPNGERWVPVHGILRHSRALAAIARISALYEANAAEMEAEGIGAGYMFLTTGTTGFLIEPVFYFPDSIEEIHRRSVEPQHLAKLKGFPRNDAARALVDRLRGEIIAIFGELEAVHLQIGRTYPLKARSPDRAWAILLYLIHIY